MPHPRDATPAARSGAGWTMLGRCAPSRHAAVAPMLAKAADELPEGDGWLYEPKWDGFRCIVFRDGDEVELGSRNERR